MKKDDNQQLKINQESITILTTKIIKRKGTVNYQNTLKKTVTIGTNNKVINIMNPIQISTSSQKNQ